MPTEDNILFQGMQKSILKHFLNYAISKKKFQGSREGSQKQKNLTSICL